MPFPTSKSNRMNWDFQMPSTDKLIMPNQWKLLIPRLAQYKYWDIKNGREEHHYLNSFIILMSLTLTQWHWPIEEWKKPQQSHMHCRNNGRCCVSFFTSSSSLVAPTAMVVLCGWCGYGWRAGGKVSFRWETQVERSRRRVISCEKQYRGLSRTFLQHCYLYYPHRCPGCWSYFLRNYLVIKQAIPKYS